MYSTHNHYIMRVR